MKRSPQSATSAKGLRCCSTLPRCRCRPRPSTTPPGSSAVTAGRSGRAGASSARASRRCWCWPTCARVRRSPSWRPGSASAPPQPGATSARPRRCWPPAPRSCGALADAKKAGHAYVVIDGTLIPVDRVAADRPFYSGKHRRHGMNLQVISAPDGEILWVSGPLPGAVHDLTAARIWGILRELVASALIVLADKGYAGAGDHVRIPYRGRNKPASQKDANRAHAQLRSPGERANAQLKTWRILRKLRCCPWRAGQLAKAIHVLQAREIAG